MENCGFANCSNRISRNEKGVRVGYQINNLNKELIACMECGMKLMTSPRGTWHVTKFKELKPIPAKPIIIT